MWRILDFLLYTIFTVIKALKKLLNESLNQVGLGWKVECILIILDYKTPSVRACVREYVRPFLTFLHKPYYIIHL